jgi:hypothetical protein
MKWCFQDRNRRCTEDCKAFTSSEECQLLLGVQQATVAAAAFTGWLVPKAMTTHPPSATPPEVKP